MCVWAGAAAQPCSWTDMLTADGDGACDAAHAVQDMMLADEERVAAQHSGLGAMRWMH